MNEESLINEVDQAARELVATVPVAFNPKAWEKMELLLDASADRKTERSWFRNRLNLFFLFLSALLLLSSGVFLLPATDLQHRSGFPEIQPQPALDSTNERVDREWLLPHTQAVPGNKKKGQPQIQQVPGSLPAVQDSLDAAPQVDTNGRDVFIFW